MMSSRREFLGSLAVATIAQDPTPLIQDSRFELEQRVRWLDSFEGMPTVGRVIGIRYQPVCDTTRIRYHVDFGTTRLWVEADSLKAV